jgi:tRNA A-37 threonylcarbamoyl transferase component Bud32
VVLKQSLHRSVRVEGRADQRVVIKRFDQRGPLARVRDAARARREFEILSFLSARGVAVPRPLALRRDGSAFEVELEWISGARTLAQQLAERAPLRLELARALGQLLADVHAAGIDHPDLHAGNVLVDPLGRVFGIDFDKSRRIAALSQKHIERDLLSLCAGLRESSPASWRAAVFAAWWAALPQSLRATWLLPDVEALEAAARTRRRRVVSARERRWTRAGSAVEVLDGAAGFCRKSVAAQTVDALLQGAALADGVLRVDGNPRELLALWRAMARLEEHGVSAPRCLLLRTRAPAAAWFEQDLPRAPSSSLGRGRLLAALLDRGLWCASLQQNAFDDSGLLQPQRLSHVAREDAARLLRPWMHSGDADGFLRGVAQGWRGTRSERKQLLADLSRG